METSTSVPRELTMTSLFTVSERLAVETLILSLTPRICSSSSTATLIFSSMAISLGSEATFRGTFPS